MFGSRRRAERTEREKKNHVYRRRDEKVLRVDVVVVVVLKVSQDAEVGGGGQAQGVQEEDRGKQADGRGKNTDVRTSLSHALSFPFREGGEKSGKNLAAPAAFFLSVCQGLDRCSRKIKRLKGRRGGEQKWLGFSAATACLS